nr:RNA-directed DNA polymerase, eukaryota [Tanacetum cinerariifolium]
MLLLLTPSSLTLWSNSSGQRPHSGHLTDDEGVADLPILEIYFGMDNLGYVTKGKLTIFKNNFLPQWRSNYIFRGIINNIWNAKKFLMYPRFLQTILGIETRVTRQYKVLVFSSKHFANMRFNFAGNPMPFLPAMLLQAQAGEGAEVDAQDITYHVSAPDQSPAHLPTPFRPQSSDPVAPVLEDDHISYQHETDAGSFPTREDAPLGGDFHTSPTRSSYAPPTGQPSGGAEDPITLTELSSIVSTLVQKVHSWEAELHDHKKLFKDVVGNPCAPTAVPPGASGVPFGISGVASAAFGVTPIVSDVSPGAFVAPTAASAIPADSPKVPTTIPADSLNVPAGISSKGKSLMVEEDIPVTARTFRQMEEDRQGKEAAKWLHDEEMAHMERERADAQRKRQQEVLKSAMHYNESDWLNIRTQVKANASLSKTLLGDDLSEDNFPARMAALIKQKRQALAEQFAIYNTGWTMAYVKSFSDEQLKQEFEKIYEVQSNNQIQDFSRTLKRPGSVLEEPSPKRPNSPEAPTPSMSEVPISPAVTSPFPSRTRRKSLGRKHMHKPKSPLPTLDLDAPAQTFLKVVVDEDSDDEDSVDELSLLTNLLETVILSNMEDIWFFDLNGDGRFCVKDVRCLLDDVFLPKAEVPTRNVAVASLLCHLYDPGMEDAAHLFFRCDMAKDVMFLVSR